MERWITLFILFSFSLVTVYSFCTSDQNSIASYEEVKDLPQHPEILLIDVRTIKEVEKTGLIPTAIHIPIAAVNETFSLKTDADKQGFYQKHGRKFPNADDQLVFYCLLGIRAKQAMETACSLGFAKSKFYKGSWHEWAEKEGLESYTLQQIGVKLEGRK